MVAQHATPLDVMLLSGDFDGEVRFSEPMARHTSLRVGGAARAYVRVDSMHALKKVLDALADTDLSWRVVGRGTNLLVSDTGYDGVILTLGRDFKGIAFDAEAGVISAGGAASLAHVVQLAFDHALSGLEFLVGTPGSIGGAVAMNAGTRTDWISRQIASVTTLRGDGTYMKYLPDELVWGYRSSPFRPDEVILECELEVTAGDPLLIQSKMEGNLSRRRRSQPLALPSCGSVFKNPAEESVAKLIEGAGLKGRRVGGACISEQHTNFIVNEGNATASDVKALMDMIESEVGRIYGIELAPEVQLIGFNEATESALGQA